MAPDTDVLKNVPIFQLFDDEELAELASQIDQKTYAAGQHIFKAAPS